MQPGLLSSSHCGRWIRAHQWLAELITQHKLFHTTEVLECAWVGRLNVFSAGLLLTLLMHDWGFTDHPFIPALIQVKIELQMENFHFPLTFFYQCRRPCSTVGHSYTKAPWTKVSFSSDSKGVCSGQHMRSQWRKLLAEGISQKISPPLVSKPQILSLARGLCWMCKKKIGGSRWEKGRKQWAAIEIKCTLCIWFLCHKWKKKKEKMKNGEK